jgi:hypothetical protein
MSCVPRLTTSLAFRLKSLCYNFRMEEMVRAVSWEAPEHRHIEKSSDWYWALGIIALAAAGASMIFGDVLFGIVILLAASTMILVAHRKPKQMLFEVSARGVRIGDELYPYPGLESFSIDEECQHGPQLILKSKHFFMPLLIIPVPEEYVDDIEDIVSPRLAEDHLHEPLSHRLLEFFGF